jgi:4-hydroxybenzoyl-CoA thioesterase
MMLSHSRQVEIEFGDCDPAGIVYFPNYFRMFDASTAYLFEAALGMKKIAWIKRYGILGIPVVDTGARFVRPSRFGDVVTITTTVTEFRRSSFELVHQLFNADELAIEGRETRVWVARDPDDPDKIKSRAVPDEVIAAFERGQS